jgi:adenylosuccinate lyase
MRQNLESLGGVTASGELLLELTQSGMAREDAYAIVQRLAMAVWDEGASFRDLAMQDSRIKSVLSAEQLEKIFDLDHQLRNVDKIFDRVFQRE